MTLGAAIAALALHVDTRSAYLSVLVVDVVSYAVAAGVTATLPRIAPVAREHQLAAFAALRDLPFVLVAAVSSILQMHYWILEIALPLWVVGHTSAPPVLVSGARGRLAARGRR